MERKFYGATLSRSFDAGEVKARADLGRIAERYTRLRRRGREYVGLCPLHTERHPSFRVCPGLGLWYCFGCMRGGDCFSLVQAVENLSFPDAVARVAGWLSGSSERAAGFAARSLRPPVLRPEGFLALTGKCEPRSLQERRARIVASLDATNRRLRAIEATNRAASAALATPCKPRGEGGPLPAPR
jgi:hypothetical protein